MKPDKEPKAMEYTIIEAEASIEKDDKHEDGRITIRCIEDLKDGIDGWVWSGMLVKDLYRGEKWHKIILKKKPLYLALYGGWNTTIQVRIWHKNKWHRIWDANNHFDSFKEEKERSDAYAKFIQDEGKKIADMIDNGKTLKQIDKLISNEHTGNTYGWAINIGINTAKDKKKAQVIRLAHNKKYGSDSKTGVANPAVLSIGGK